VIQDDPDLRSEIRLIGVTVKNTEKQAAGYKAAFKVKFPVFPDENGGISKAAGNPKVPSLILATPGGEVLLVHNGVIGDLDDMLREIRAARGR